MKPENKVRLCDVSADGSLYQSSTDGAVLQSRGTGCTGNKMAAGQEDEVGITDHADLTQPLFLQLLILLGKIG